MKTVKEYCSEHSDLIEIKSTVCNGDYAIRIIFNDGVNKPINLNHFLKHQLIHQFENTWTSISSKNLK